MFEDENVIKMKKDQFIEAESVAYLIEDEMKRKLAFANTCCLFAFKNYAEKNRYKYKPITNINLFRVPAVAQKYGISDLYLGNARIDVRVSLDGKVFPIPKCHIKNSLAADFYVVYKGTKNPLKCEGIGYIKRDDLIFDSQDDEYYYISVAILNPLADLKAEISNFPQDVKNFYETEHKLSQENFGAFLDGDLDDVRSLDMMEHLLECEKCRTLFVEYSFLEDILTAVKHYPDIKEDVENTISENEKVQEPEIEQVNEIATEPAIEPLIVSTEGETIQENVVLDEVEGDEASTSEIDTEDIIINENETDSSLSDEIIIDEQTLDYAEDIDYVSEENTPVEELPQNEDVASSSGLLYENQDEQIIPDTDTEEEPVVEISDNTEEKPVLLYEDVTESNTNEEEDDTPVLKYDFSIHEKQQEEPVESQELTEESISIDSDDIITFDDDLISIDDTDTINTAESIEFDDVPENANQDEYSITENNEELNISDDISDDDELNNFLLNDIKETVVELEEKEGNVNENADKDMSADLNNTSNENQENTAEFNIEDSPTEVVFEDNLNENVMEDNLNDEPINKAEFDTDESELDVLNSDDEQSSISFEDIFSDDDDDIEVENDVAENLQNDTELQNILNDKESISDVQEEISTSNWNQLFTTNASKTIEQEDIDVNNVPIPDNISSQSAGESENLNSNIDIELNNGSDNIVNSEMNENIETLYDQISETDNIQQNDINQVIEQVSEQPNEKTVKEEKKSSAGIIAVIVVMFAVLLVALGGVAYYGLNNINKNSGSASVMPNTENDNQYNDNENDMNRVMTDAFADNSAGVTVSKMSWEKNKSATLTKDLESYLNTTASSIWDNLEVDLIPVQGYSASQPAKISILVSKEGEVKNIKVSQSCGSKDIDDVVLKSVKKVIESVPPTAYSIKGENINLTLVVNF